MHVVVLFYNIGGYHAARLRAADLACKQRGWQMSAIQVTDHTQERPWGDVSQEMAFSCQTLLPIATSSEADRGPYANAPATLLPACLETLRPDVLAIPGWGFPISRAALAWCQRRQVPTILMSESKWNDEPRQWWKEQIKSWLYIRKYAAALVGGELHREYLVRLGMARDRIFLGYNAVDNDYFAKTAAVARQDPQAAHQRQPAIPHRPYFLVVTRLIPRKNVLKLVEAFVAYRQHIGAEQAWDLVICGSGLEETAIRYLINQQDLTHCVHLPGFIPYRDIGDWFGLAAAFVHPALQEQWGLVVNEACAAGLPILCSETVGACAELVQNGVNGFSFNPSDRQDMTRALLAIHQLTPQARLQMGMMSQELVADYGPQQFAQGLISAVEAGLLQSVR